MFTAFYLETDDQTEIVTKKPNVLFKRMLTISKITKITSFLKQKLQ
jgi:hypothetical protein